MEIDLKTIFFPLFVPGDRPERFIKAATSGCDCVIVDLEDAVAPQNKITARERTAAALSQLKNISIPVIVRINAAGSAWHDGDIALLQHLSVAGVMLPKAERKEDLMLVANALGNRAGVIALIESAAGIANARALASAAARLAFGSLDFAADLGCAHTREALLLSRLELVLASRLAGLPGPIDGVTTAIDAEQAIEDDAAYAAGLGFSGKLLIHPRQIAPAKRGFFPTAKEIEWAQRVVASATTGVANVDGAMVDAPVLRRAQLILKRRNINSAN
jgi:citrate lyase subunit beta/citryl-CoA lyase